MTALVHLVLALCSIAFADDAAPGGLLAGPSAAAAPAPPTIVDRGFDGALEPLDDEPEVAAAFRLKLEDDRRAKVEAIAAARAAAFEGIVLANYDDFLRLGNDLRSIRTMAPDARTAALGRLRDLRSALRPFVARGTFLDECAAELTEQQRADANRMAGEWRAARMAELAKETGMADGGSPDAAVRERLEARMQLESLGQMVKRTIQRRADARNAQFEAVVRQLDLGPEQAEKVKAVFMEIAVEEIQGKRERGQLSMRERRRVFGELAKILDETQRGKLRDLLLGDPGSAGG